MIIFQELSKPIPQAVFARIVGRSEGRVSQWVADGTLKAGESGLTWLHAVIDRLSNEAAGRHTDGPLDLAQERAALAREQRIGIKMKNAIARREYAPVEYLTLTLATASAAFAERMDFVPARLRREHPDLPAAALDAVLRTLADARNAFVDGLEELQLPMRGDFDADDDTEAED